MKKRTLLSLLLTAIMLASTLIPSVSAAGTPTTQVLGQPVKTVYLNTSTGGYDAKLQKQVIYTVVRGTPGHFLSVDAATGEILRNVPLTGSGWSVGGCWEVFRHSSGDIYFGCDNSARIVKFDMDTETLVNLGHPGGQATMFMQMCEDNQGNIWGTEATYSQLYKIDTTTDTFTQIINLMPTAKYNFSSYCIDYYSGGNDLIVSAIDTDTNVPYIWRVDLNSGGTYKRDILPPAYKSVAPSRSIRRVGTKLFVQTGDFRMFVLDLTKRDADSRMTITNLDTGVSSLETTISPSGFSMVSPFEPNVIYFAQDRKLYKFDVNANTYQKVSDKILVKESPLQKLLLFEDLNTTNLSGWNMVSLDGPYGAYVQYNFDTDSVYYFDTEITNAGQPNNINCLVKGNDGKIYAGGYVGGNAGSYDIATGTISSYGNVRQVEGMAAYENYIVIGQYPGAKMTRYDTSQPWVGRVNPPREMYNINETGKTPQDRPYNILAIPEEGVAAIATVAGEGQKGSAFSLWNMAANTHENVFGTFTDQTIVSLAYSGGKLYGGTSIRPGINTSATATQAEFFSYDFTTKTVKKYGAILPGITMISALITAPDGKIWGMGENKLFVFDPATEKVTYQATLNLTARKSNWQDMQMFLSKDASSVYIANYAGQLAKVNLSTKAFTLLFSGGGIHWAKDDNDNFYYSSGADLVKLTL